MNRFRTLVAFFLMTIFSSFCFGQLEQTLAGEVAGVIKEKLPDMLSEASIPGAAVAVVDDRNVVWEKAYGYVDTANARPVDMNTIFSIQSMSKSFTALAVLMAVQDGMLELDRPIKEYLPDFTVNSLYDKNPERIIALRHLLSHWSGLTHEAPFGSNNDDRYDFTEHKNHNVNVGEGHLNALGYRLLGNNRLKVAIETFKFVVSEYPESSNAYDSLGEAYMMAGEKELAIKNYEKSLELNPKNDNAKKMLEDLRKK